MPPMKLTPIAAMRARDVSRPRAEHLAEAEAAEVTPPGSSRAATPSGAAAKGRPGYGGGRDGSGDGGQLGDRRGNAYRRRAHGTTGLPASTARAAGLRPTGPLVAVRQRRRARPR